MVSIGRIHEHVYLSSTRCLLVWSDKTLALPNIEYKLHKFKSLETFKIVPNMMKTLENLAVVTREIGEVEGLQVSSKSDLFDTFTSAVLNFRAQIFSPGICKQTNRFQYLQVKTETIHSNLTRRPWKIASSRYFMRICSFAIFGRVCEPCPLSCTILR